MAKYFIEDTTLTSIANIIREKEGSTEVITAADMPSRIANLPESDEIANSRIVEVIAQDQIKIGDTVYTVEKNGVSDLEAEFHMIDLTQTIYTAAFSPDGKTLVLGGSFTGYGKVYSVSGQTIAYVSDIYADSGTTALSSLIRAAAFSPDGKTLVLGGQFSGRGKVYAVNGQSITYVSDIYADSGTTALSNTVYTAAFSPDGKTLVLGGQFSGRGKVYSVNGQSITYVSDIYADSGTTALSSSAQTAAFSPDGKTLVLGGQFSGKAKVYSVNGQTITYVSDIYADSGTTALSGSAQTAAFSPDGKTLVLGGQFTGRGKVYSVNGQTITYVSDIYAGSETTALNNYVYTAAFSPDGKTLVLGGDFSGSAKVYSVNGQTITYVSDIYANTGITALSNYVQIAAFSPDGKTLVLGGKSYGYSKVYSVDGQIIAHVRDMYAGSSNTALSGNVYAAAFSPDGKTLVLGGATTGKAKVYSVNGQSITYVSDIYADSGTTALSGTVYTAAFSPDGKTLVLGGYFSGYAKVYSVNGQSITYVSDIYADSGTTALNEYVYTAAFSPDGKTLVLGGTFTGYAKVYSVNGQSITYVSDVYADSGTTALSGSVRTAAFSPDGKTLVLGGATTGRAKVYSVNGQTITYVSDIYADAGTTALSSSAQTAAFSPDGKTLVLGGWFTGYAKVYSVNGQSITYVSDIYANTGATALSKYVEAAAFSPDGKTLVLGGWFTGYAKVYSVNGQTITYVSDIYADSGTTALNNYVRTAAFSPDGTALVLGGDFSGYGKTYPIYEDEIDYIEERNAYLAENGEFTELPYGCSIGFSKSDANIGETVTVRTIGKYMVKGVAE